MELRYSTFIMPHIGDLYSQCADRFAIGKEHPCFAIADGVGASFYPEIWADLVSGDFVNNPETFVSDNKLTREEQLINNWSCAVNDRNKQLTASELFIIDMAKEKCDFAACTFVGLIVDKYKWKCSALGDSYLFVLDKNYQIIDSVASQKGETFDNFPEYFASKTGNNNGSVVTCEDKIDNVAYFVLLTDAISDWFIKVDSAKREELIHVKDLSSFRSLVTKERESGELKDDDTSAVIIEVINDGDEFIKLTELFTSNIHQLIAEEEIAEEKRKQDEEDARKKEDEVEKQTSITDCNTKSEETQIIEEDSHEETKQLNLTENPTPAEKELLLKNKLIGFIETSQVNIESIKSEAGICRKSNNENNSLWRNIIKSLNGVLDELKHTHKLSNKINKDHGATHKDTNK